MAATEVEEIKQKLDIVTLVSKYITMKKRGRHYLACCPFHSEKTPSFIISPELQIFKCFGCGKSGDIFTFVQEYDHVTFPEALEELAKLAGVKIIKSAAASKEEQLQKRLIELNLEAAKFYHYILTKHALGKPALDYVLGRGIKSEMIDLFRIGFSPQNSTLILNYLRKKGFTTAELIASGTFGQAGYRFYDRFQSRLIFPLTDYRDRILGFSGRILPTNTNPNMAKYINSPETPIYHKSNMLFGLNLSKDAIRTSSSVIVVEGEFDMISPYQAGIKNIVALKGTAFTQEQLHLLHRYTDTLILGLDSDFAGNNAARRSIELADSMEFDIKVLTLGEKYKDPDEAVKGDLEFFKNQLEHTLPVWDFIIQSTVKANDIDTIKGKKNVLAITLPFIVKIKNSVIRSDYYQKLAALLGSDLDSIKAEAQNHASPSPSKSSPEISVNSQTNQAAISLAPPQTPDREPISPTQKFEEELLILILGAKKPASLAAKLKDHLVYVKTRSFQSIINLLLETSDFEVVSFQSRLPPELHEIFQGLYFKATEAELESKQRSDQIKKTITRIESTILKDRISVITRDIARAETSGDQDKLEELEKEYSRLLLALSNLQSKNV